MRSGARIIRSWKMKSEIGFEIASADISRRWDPFAIGVPAPDPYHLSRECTAVRLEAHNNFCDREGPNPTRRQLKGKCSGIYSRRESTTRRHFEAIE